MEWITAGRPCSSANDIASPAGKSYVRTALTLLSFSHAQPYQLTKYILYVCCNPNFIIFCCWHAEQGLCKGSRSANHLDSGRPRVHSHMVQLLQCRILLWISKSWHPKSITNHLYSTKPLYTSHYHNTYLKVNHISRGPFWRKKCFLHLIQDSFVTSQCIL